MTRTNLMVVGVDGSKESRRALEWAMEEAEHRGMRVLAASTWTSPPVPMDPPFASFPWGAGRDPVEEIRTMLNEMVGEVSAEHPDVGIDQRVVAGNAAAELIQLSAQADLVVVGAKGHGGFTGMLIGSVSQHVLAHSRCTVVVVR